MQRVATRLRLFGETHSSFERASTNQTGGSLPLVRSAGQPTATCRQARSEGRGAASFCHKRLQRGQLVADAFFRRSQEDGFEWFMGGTTPRP